MAYKRIFQIRSAELADAVAAEANHFKVTFRAARSGNVGEYVIEGEADQAQDIETIISSIEAMDAQQDIENLISSTEEMDADAAAVL